MGIAHHFVAVGYGDHIAATLLAAAHVAAAYGKRPVLRDVSLTLPAGEVLALIGPNGSGKSTLIKTLLGHVPLTGGDVAWQGRPLAAWRPREFSRLVAYLPQSPAFDPEQTVADVLKLGRAMRWGAFGVESSADIAAVERVATQLDLAAMLRRPMHTLSGGQRQRVFVGRCLVQEPAALVLDEPNTFLDLKHAVELGRLVRSLATEQNLAVLMASHDLNLTAMIADRVALLSEGQVVVTGTPPEVLDRASLTAAYGLPLERYEIAGRIVVTPR